MGRTGESYLVGSNKLMHPDSYLDPENHSVNASFPNPEKGRVDTDAAKEAFSRNTNERNWRIRPNNS
jgi:methyl-accepting chemotaxis protein